MPDRAVNAARSGSFYVKMSLDQNIPVCYTAIDIKRTERGPDIKFFKKVGSAINTALSPTRALCSASAPQYF